MNLQNIIVQMVNEVFSKIFKFKIRNRDLNLAFLNLKCQYRYRYIIRILDSSIYLLLPIMLPLSMYRLPLSLACFVIEPSHLCLLGIGRLYRQYRRYCR